MLYPLIYVLVLVPVFTYIWVILPNLVHTGSLQFLAIFLNLAANEHGFLSKTSKI